MSSISARQMHMQFYKTIITGSSPQPSLASSKALVRHTVNEVGLEREVKRRNQANCLSKAETKPANMD